MNIIKNEILDCKILIVEDDYLGRVVLKEIFKQQGFKNIEEAENGREGLEKINSFRPDLIILDVIMPEIDGVECCKQIRKNSDSSIANVPILFQTALDGLADKARLFEAGATDYLTKPVDPNEITARVVVHLEREVMTKRLREFNLRVESELEIARATQNILIPAPFFISEIEEAYKLQICSHYQSCTELGGDFWGIKSLSNDELAIYMVDFSGHGVNAALNVFRLHALMETAVDTARTPSAHLTYLNSILAPLLLKGQFATMFYGVINSRRNSLSYASAASPPPILFNKQASLHQLIDSTGTLLGAFKESVYKMEEVEFNIGDCLLLYSDALIETANDGGKMISIENWIDSFKANLKSERDDCQRAFDGLLADFNKNCSKNLRDDLTLTAYFNRG